MLALLVLAACWPSSLKTTTSNQGIVQGFLTTSLTSQELEKSTRQRKEQKKVKAKEQ